MCCVAHVLRPPSTPPSRCALFVVLGVQNLLATHGTNALGIRTALTVLSLLQQSAASMGCQAARMMTRMQTSGSWIETTGMWHTRVGAVKRSYRVPGARCSCTSGTCCWLAPTCIAYTASVTDK